MKTTTYHVHVRVLGGEWEIYSVEGQHVHFADLELALGMAATLKDDIRETVVSQVVSFEWVIDGIVTTVREYSLVE